MDKLNLIKLDFSKLSSLDKEIYERMPYLFDNIDNKNININEFLKLSESNKSESNKSESETEPKEIDV